MSLALNKYSYSFRHLLYRPAKRKQIFHPSYLCELDYRSIVAYEKAILYLLPLAEQWTLKEWLDEHNALEAFITVYGIDYSHNDACFSRIIDLANDVAHGRCDEDTIWHIHAIDTMPLSLAHVLWPTYTERNFVELFLRIYEQVVNYDNQGLSFADATSNEKHPYGYFSKEYLKKCWLYKLVRKWVAEGKIPAELCHQAKKAIFDVEVTI